MGLLEEIVTPVLQHFQQLSAVSQVVGLVLGFVLLSVVINVAHQLLFKNPNEPPIVFHLFPIIGSTITYGINPPQFFVENRMKFGDIFTFILLGKKITVYVGPDGNEFILNGKAKDVNAEQIYSPLTTPVFGKDVVYDCPNSKLMEQKRLIKMTLTTDAFKSYVPIISHETNSLFKKAPELKGHSGTVNIAQLMAQLTIFTASHCLQGKICRDQFDEGIADLYHDLDMGFTPINFMLPWFPLPQNRKRDHARERIAKIYSDTLQRRRAAGEEAAGADGDKDVMLHLMHSTYKDGRAVPDHEISHMMIALLMAGQHSSSSTSTWILLRLASRPDIQEELYQEQIRVLGCIDKPLEYEDLSKLILHSDIIKETLRMHAPIHSILRKVLSPMHVTGTKYTIPPTHNLMAAPGVSGNDASYFPEPQLWEPHRWEVGSPLAPKFQVKTEEDEEKIDYGYGLISKGASSPYLPFGAGRHRCIGEQFAYLQLRTITANVVRQFKLRTTDGSTGTVPGTDYSSLFSRALEPANIIWEKRVKA